MNHDAENRTISFYGRINGFYATSGMIRVTAPNMPQTVIGVQVTGNNFSTNMVHLPEGVLTTIEIILQASDGRRFSTTGYARAKNPGYRGFTETRQVQ